MNMVRQIDIIHAERRRSADLAGKSFGKLTVLRVNGMDASGKNSMWLCKCECGKEVVFGRPSLRRKGLHSCGCSTSRTIRDAFTTHGMTESTAYRAWTNMKTRCLNPRRKGYNNYGGRGIGISEPWINSFENFLSDMGNPEKGLSLERVDNDKGYSKENCTWIPKNNQSKNRRININVLFGSEKITIRELWIRTGMKHSYSTFIKYAKRGEECNLYA
jgi:hypothetical protein